MNATKKFMWFKLENYSRCNLLEPKQWANEIQNRLLMDHFLFEIGNEEPDMMALSLSILENIKQNGLLSFNCQTNLFFNYQDVSSSGHYVQNLNVMDAYDFLYSSYRREEFIADADRVNKISPDDKMHISSMIEFAKKYGLPMSIENIENNKRFAKKSGIEADGDNGYRFLQVDINAADDVLVSEFRSWLQKEKSDYKSVYPSKKFSDAEIGSWCKHQLLAFWDINTVAKFEKLDLTYHELGDMLFPNDIDVAISERVRKVIKPKCKSIFTDVTCEILQSM